MSSNDETTENRRLWNALARAGVVNARPWKDLTQEGARARVDGRGVYGDVAGKRVLCLASGGGQQSIAFALLGATVTVTDASEEQLSRDRETAQSLGLEVRAIQADQRDFSAFHPQEFDIVHQPYSINYVSSTGRVFDGVAHVLKEGGVYHVMFHNPVVHGSWKDACWGSSWKEDELCSGIGYPLRQPYEEGHPVEFVDPHWHFVDAEGNEQCVDAPQEYKHTLSTILNGVIERGMNVIAFDEYVRADAEPGEPGTWEHYVTVAAPWMSLWARRS